MNIYILEWTEYERGWGSRPDGLQIFTSSRMMLEILEKDRKERNEAKTTPREYSIPTTKYVCEIDEEFFKVMIDNEKILHEKPYWFTTPGKRDIDYLKKFPSFKVISTERL